MSFRDFLKRHTPLPVRLMSRRLRSLPRHLKDKRRSTKTVFTEIYAENIWNDCKPLVDTDFPFYSGPGSEEKAASPYADCVNAFIDTHGVKTVVDLGCGDFRVGIRLARPTIRYIGVDIVEPLIQANQARFGNDHIEFRCLDIITDPLPIGDLCLVREVLQHLSNSQIAAIITKLKAFKWVIVTECHPGPVGTFKANLDKPHGSGTRVHWDSGVVLSEPPFNMTNVSLLRNAPLALSGRPGARISSFLFRN